MVHDKPNRVGWGKIIEIDRLQSSATIMSQWEGLRRTIPMGRQESSGNSKRGFPMERPRWLCVAQKRASVSPVTGGFLPKEK